MKEGGLESPQRRVVSRLKGNHCQVPWARSLAWGLGLLTPATLYVWNSNFHSHPKATPTVANFQEAAQLGAGPWQASWHQANFQLARLGRGSRVSPSGARLPCGRRGAGHQVQRGATGLHGQLSASTGRRRGAEADGTS